MLELLIFFAVSFFVITRAWHAVEHRDSARLNRKVRDHVRGSRDRIEEMTRLNLEANAEMRRRYGPGYTMDSLQGWRSDRERHEIRKLVSQGSPWARQYARRESLSERLERRRTERGGGFY